MSFRPAGYSSDEDDDEFENFSFHGELKSQREQREEIAAEVYRSRLEDEKTAQHRFYTAVINGNVDNLRKELKNGFDINAVVSSNWTALFLAASQGNPIIVEELLKNNADVNLTKDATTPLMAVCSCTKSSTTVEDTLKTVQLLIDYGINVKAKDCKRRTAFMFACEQGFLEVVQFLLPLNYLEEQDNQGWTALFYAVNNNEDEIVKFLLENNANAEHYDARNNDVKYYATLNDFEAILNILPKSDFDISPDDFANNDYDYESIFELLEDGQKPNFKSDISSLLFGMRCQNLIPMFNKNDVDLSTFLTLNDEELRKLGISLSFERNRILQGLFKFHEHTWKRKSVPFVPIDEIFTTHDIFVTLTNTVKHLVVLEATIKYLKQNLNINEVKKDIVSVKTMMALRKINRLKLTVNSLHKKVLIYEKYNQGEADLITNKIEPRKNLFRRKIILSFTGVTFVFLLRYLKSRLL